MSYFDATGTKQPTRTEQARAAAEAARPQLPSHQYGRGAHPERGPQREEPPTRRALDDGQAAIALDKRGLFGPNALTPEAPAEQPIESAPEGLLNSDLPEVEEELESPAVAASEGEGPAIDEEDYSLSDLAADLEIDLDTLLGKVTAATKIDGQSGRVKLGELLSSYQQQGHITRTQQALAAERTKLNTEHSSRLAAVDKTHADATSLLEVAKTFILGEYAGVDWQKEFAEDPTTAGPRYFGYQQRVAAFNEAVGKQAIANQERAQQRNVSLGEYKEAELLKLHNAVPAWADHEVAMADRTRIEKYALDLGFTPQEIGTVLDHRQIRVLHDAARYAELKGVRDPAKHRGANATPRINAKPGARTATPGGLSSVNLSKAKARLKSTGDVRDAAAVLEARLGARGRGGR